MTTAETRTVPAVVTAGDSRAAKAVYGESKVFLELAGRPLIVHVARVLQDVAEIDSVWIVGNRARLEAVFADPAVREQISKPLHIVEQLDSLLANAWEAYRCILSGDPTAGRDPVSEEDLDQEILYLSGDLPFATPQEISALIRQSRDQGSDYTCGLTTEQAMQPFRPRAPGEPGIEVAYFNLRDGRLRQTNLHYAKPARLGNLPAIEEMYEHRHQRQFWNMAVLAWRVLFSHKGGLRVVFFYCVMHLSGLLDRWGWRRLSDLLRVVTVQANEEVVGRILDTHFRFSVTDAGGCAVDIDTEQEFDASKENYERWIAEQRKAAADLYGPVGLPAQASKEKPR